MCRSKLNFGKMPRNGQHTVRAEENTNTTSSEDDRCSHMMFTVKGKACKPIVQTISINGVGVDMGIDTGAAYSVITQTTYQRIAQMEGVRDMEASDLNLKSYSGDLIRVLDQLPVVILLGENSVSCTYKL